MKTLRILALGTLLLSVSGCFGPKEYFITDAYKDLVMHDATLAVLFDPENIVVQNKSSIHDDWGRGNSQEIFITILKSHLPERMIEHSTFSRVRTPLLSGDTSLRPVYFDTDTADLQFLVPEPGDSYRFGEEQYDVVLVLERIITFEVREDITEDDPEGDRKLVYDFEYLFWDNHAGRVIAYGARQAKNEVISDIFSPMNQNTWKNCLSDLCRKAVEDTPFEN